MGCHIVRLEALSDPSNTQFLCISTIYIPVLRLVSCSIQSLSSVVFVLITTISLFPSVLGCKCTLAWRSAGSWEYMGRSSRGGTPPSRSAMRSARTLYNQSKVQLKGKEHYEEINQN